ncbi:MAG: hypothetical protein HYZ09_03110 [Candidatus Kerfeldbacteria bacterium]|nr:hypothetical protein [Candidatus Kerfeldbacteria bacterium]
MRRFFFVLVLVLFAGITGLVVVVVRRIASDRETALSPDCRPQTVHAISVTPEAIEVRVGGGRYYVVDAETRTVTLRGVDIRPQPVNDSVMVGTLGNTANEYLTLEEWTESKAIFHLRHQDVDEVFANREQWFDCRFFVDRTYSG